jgi:opacity protein-like surface antigen
MTEVERGKYREDKQEQTVTIPSTFHGGSMTVRNLAAGAALLAACVSATALAQPGISVAFGVHGNLTNANFPGPDIKGTSVLRDVYGAGLGGGAHLDVRVAMLGLRLSGDYLRFSPDNDMYRNSLAALIGTAASQFSVDGGGITFLSLTANAKMAILPLPILSPYLTGGAGLARISADDARVLQNGTPTNQFPGFESETKISLNAGVGVDLNIGVTLFLEVRYTWVFTDPNTSTLVPVLLGITF